MELRNVVEVSISTVPQRYSKSLLEEEPVAANTLSK
jgi:hypothetical protein